MERIPRVAASFQLINDYAYTREGFTSGRLRRSISRFWDEREQGIAVADLSSFG